MEQTHSTLSHSTRLDTSPTLEIGAGVGAGETLLLLLLHLLGCPYAAFFGQL